MNTFEKELINIDIIANDWEEALKNTGFILENLGYINKTYITNLINLTKKIGPYYVITKNVALPHLRPEEGVLKSGISFFTLKEKVDFLGNDIKFLIYILALDNEEHILKIESITKLLEDFEFFEKIEKKLINKDEIIKYLEKY